MSRVVDLFWRNSSVNDFILDENEEEEEESNEDEEEKEDKGKDKQEKRIEDKKESILGLLIELKKNEEFKERHHIVHKMLSSLADFDETLRNVIDVNLPEVSGDKQSAREVINNLLCFSLLLYSLQDREF